MEVKPEKDSIRKFLTTKELAMRWRMAYGTLKNWRSEGLGPDFVKLPSKSGKGYKVLYSLESIRKFEFEAGLVEDDFHIKIELD